MKCNSCLAKSTCLIQPCKQFGAKLFGKNILKIAIIGTVGVPARYGGFETLAEQLAKGIKPEAHQLVIYCQRTAYPELDGGECFEGHQRVLLPLRANGPASMVHDMLAMAHAALIAKVDTMLVLGYSGAWFLPFVRLLQPRIRVITNIDGMEWRRDKFGRFARTLLRTLESFATRFSHVIIADNAALVTIAKEIHDTDSVLIAYGGDHTLVQAAPPVLSPGYFLSIARIEPENNCHVILAACAHAGVRLAFVGNWEANAYGRGLKAQFANLPNLILLDAIYDQSKLSALRLGAACYIHGHSVGGTNPSLVEALFHTTRLLAFDCVFNHATLAEAGAYFGTREELETLLTSPDSGQIDSHSLSSLRQRYRWETIIDLYLKTCTFVTA